MNINDEMLIGLLLNSRQRKYILSKSEDKIKTFINSLDIIDGPNDIQERFSVFYLKNEMKSWI